ARLPSRQRRLLLHCFPRNVRVSEAPSHGKPVMIYDFRCPGSTAYIQLAKEFLARQKPVPPAQEAA
ncbi:MAG TPA: hypothetical protein PKW15_08825, partial [Alphaproteobacteria bacterium]|nr:hypothetical protein [Alphaproteobacteria bacterium]